MAKTPRKMRLTPEHLARVAAVPDPGQPHYPGVRPANDADYQAVVDAVLAGAPAGDFWLFAYGSLIWRPETDFVEQRLGTARGWHRNFCLYDVRYRGNPAQPGLMLCLDRGGQCQGVVYRLPVDGLRANLDRLVRREISHVPTPFPPRWIPVVTDTGPLRALAFAISRADRRYRGGLSLAERADYLASASGWKGSMAEYLYSTVSKLEELGIRDRNLWHLQAMVADRIEQAASSQHVPSG